MHLSFILALVCGASAFAGEIRILDWNIDKGKRFDDIARTIRAFQPDLCFLQEVDANARRTRNVSVTDDLAGELGYRSFFAPAYQELAQRVGEEPAWLGQGLLTRLPVRNTRILHFEAQSSFWQPRPWLPNWPVLQRRLGGRVAQVVEIETLDGLVVVYNLHLESRSVSARMGQVEETLADARKYPRDVPVVIAGDLNTHFHQGKYGERFKTEGFESCFGDEHPKTQRLGRVDWIFVRGPAKCTDAAVHHGTPGSDHYPITVKLMIERNRSAHGRPTGVMPLPVPLR